MAKSISFSKILIDTNIFLEYLLDQEKADEVEELLNLVAKGNIEGIITSFTLHSLEIILISHKKLSVLIDFLEEMSYLKGLSVYQPGLSEEIEIVESLSKTGLDFDDAYQYYAAKKLNLVLVSFDKHFDKTNLKRYEPKEIVSSTKI